ncbi:MAG: AAA family ATPase [Nanoarchaeota archaeon]
MKVVFIYGPPAVGKATAARELSRLTGFRYFTNHAASDPVSAILDFEENPSRFRSVANSVKNLILGSAVDMGLPGLIMTFCYSRPDSDKNLGETMDLLRRKGADVAFVRLHCSDEELFRRVKDPSRKTMSARKLTSVEELQEALRKHNFKEEIPHVENLFIDNTTISSKAVAEKIAGHHGLPTLE